MIVLDTNVLSALMLREPDARVVAWLDGLPAASVWTSAVTIYEVRMGLEILVESRRRSQLENAFARVLEEDLEGRVLPFDPPAAEAAGRLAAERRLAGHSMEIRDVQIAGIAKARKATLATRNIRHFKGCGLVLVSPWPADSKRKESAE